MDERISKIEAEIQLMGQTQQTLSESLKRISESLQRLADTSTEFRL